MLAPASGTQKRVDEQSPKRSFLSRQGIMRTVTIRPVFVVLVVAVGVRFERTIVALPISALFLVVCFLPGRRATGGYVKALTARATIKPKSARATVDWRSIVYLARCVRGITSVGLNAVALVKPRWR